MPPPENWLTKLTKSGHRQPSTHLLWVNARDTPADIEARSHDCRGTGTPRRHICARSLETAG
jgi:hypothetical protein